jgi:hypothetical protein
VWRVLPWSWVYLHEQGCILGGGAHLHEQGRILGGRAHLFEVRARLVEGAPRL